VADPYSSTVGEPDERHAREKNSDEQEWMEHRSPGLYASGQRSIKLGTARQMVPRRIDGALTHPRSRSPRRTLPIPVAIKGFC